MMQVVLDGYSISDQDPGKLRALSGNPYDIIGITNYLGHSAKVGTPEQIQGFIDHGFLVSHNFELSGSEWMQGYPRGVQDGRDARSQIRRYGVPDEIPITQSTDTSVGPSQLSVLSSYQRGFNDGAGGAPQGAYGPGFALAHLAQEGLIRVVWQWKDGRVPSIAQANMRQTYLQPWSVAAIGCPYDLNFVLQGYWGQYPAAVDPPLPPLPPEDSMPDFSLVRHNGGPVYRVASNEQSKVILTSLQAIACDFDVMRLHGDPNPHIVDLIDDVNHNWQDWLDSIPTKS